MADNNIFISWSGASSQLAASALREWIPEVIQRAHPWMSTEIEAGRRWQAELAAMLEQCHLGIICVTPTNPAALWINFEAGALAKSVQDAYVCPYLIGLAPAGVPQGPLTQFQMKEANEEGTLALVRTIDRALPGGPLDGPRLERAFSRLWGDLQTKLDAALQAEPAEEVSRPMADMVSEILDLTRGISRRMGGRGPLLHVVEEGILRGTGHFSFSNAQATAPLVLVTPLSAGHSSEVTSVSASGFSVTVRDKQGETVHDVPFRWVALG